MVESGIVELGDGGPVVESGIEVSVELGDGGSVVESGNVVSMSLSQSFQSFQKRNKTRGMKRIDEYFGEVALHFNRESAENTKTIFFVRSPSISTRGPLSSSTLHFSGNKRLHYIHTPVAFR